MQTSAVLGCLAANIRDLYKSAMRATRPLNRIIRVGLGLCELYQCNTWKNARAWTMFPRMWTWLWMEYMKMWGIMSSVGSWVCVRLYQFSAHGQMQELEPWLHWCECGYEWNIWKCETISERWLTSLLCHLVGHNTISTPQGWRLFFNYNLAPG